MFHIWFDINKPTRSMWMNIEFWNIPLFKLHYLFDYLSNKSKYSLHKKNSFCLSCSNSLKVCVVLWHLSSRFVYMGIERVADKSIWESSLYVIKLLLQWGGNPNLMWWNIDHQLISQVSWNKKNKNYSSFSNVRGRKNSL